MSGKCKVEKEIFHMPCEIMWCHNPVEYKIGNPEGPPNNYFRICKECAESLKESFNETLEEVRVEEKKTTKKGNK